MNQQFNSQIGNLININFNLNNVNQNLNRRGSQNTNSEYEEIVNTTIQTSSNRQNINDGENSDNISMFSFNTINTNNFEIQQKVKANLEKKETLVSSGNLTQLNKIYAIKSSDNIKNNIDSNNLIDKDKNAEELILNLQNQEQNDLNLNQISQNNDHIIQEYMQLKNFEITRFDSIFCLSVDGSIHSEQAFEIVTDDFLKKETDKMLIIHIFNSSMDEYYNFRNKKDTIIEKYNTRLLKIDKSKTLFLKEDRISKVHALEQVNRIASNHKCSFLISGYYGIKGPKGDNKELSKGVDYLLSFSRSPTILIKENTLRKNKPNGQIKWLFVFDRAYMNCYSILNRFLPLINNERDFVFGYTLLPNWINFDDIKKNFIMDMELCRINNYDYEAAEYLKAPSELVKEKVNFGDLHFDYLVFYNNPERHRNDGKSSDTVNLITKCASNICFINGP